MRIAVVGLGGVGGYIAACLSKTSNEVVGFARGEHLAKIKKDGIKIVEDSVEWSAPLDAKALHEADGKFDIALFCVKSYDLKSSFEAMKTSIDSNTIIISFSNGVNHGEELREWSESIVLDGCIYILSHIQDSGVIRKKGKVFAAVFGREEKATQNLQSIFDAAELRTKTPSDIQTAIWKKYLFISAFATLTSYYNTTIGYIIARHYDEAEALLQEISYVAKEKGIDIQAEIQKALDIAKGLPYDATTSMYLDFKNKKTNELETLSGYIVKEAKIHQIKIPIMKKMYEGLL